MKRLAEHEFFITKDNKRIENLNILLDDLKSMDNQIYDYHKEHFPSWIITFFDKSLGEKIKGKSKEEMIQILDIYLNKKKEEKKETDHIKKIYSSLNGLHAIEMHFSYHGKQTQAKHIQRLIEKYEKIHEKEIKDNIHELKKAIDEVKLIMKDERIEEKKKIEIMDILNLAKEEVENL